jgi:hypothetical protein
MNALDALRDASFADQLGRYLYLDWDALNERQKHVRCNRILETAADWIERELPGEATASKVTSPPKEP